ncbi:kinase-like domain-containing protein [Echria macrotheca]|uniref:EKC/KEOPS complex subunit BUD32 n=1 Tax=Echria macrotheca TaxID=438768 RepID=A0AAJ0B750_9PEZI|nr:kinase-like domain-containing protein [Echria macrotheca]
MTEPQAAPASKIFYELDRDTIQVEDPNAYGPGGFHPVRLGDLLGDDGRFRVVHKLGDGGWGTVWLCHDKATGKWRAVKIQAANASKPEDCPELATVEKFAKFSWDELASHHVSIPLEHFWLDGPNGRHLCWVMPLYGPRVCSLFGQYAKCPRILKDICAQIAAGLDFLHRNGICHGDLRPENVLLRLVDGADSLPEEQILKVLGPPVLVKVEPIGADQVEPGVPEYLVERTSIECATGLCSTRVLITDLGIAYEIDNPPDFTGIPLPFAAPENVFGGKSIGPATDIWALGVTIQKICADTLPFGDQHEPRELTRNLERKLGPMPQPYRRAWGVEGFNFEYTNDADDETQYVTFLQSELEAEKRAIESFQEDGITDEILMDLVAHPKDLPRLFVSQSQADEIAKQDPMETGVLPGYSGSMKPWEMPWDDRIEHRNDVEEMKVLRDLLARIYRWHPEDRPSLDQIADHAFFEEWYDCIPESPLHSVPSFTGLAGCCTIL